MSNRFSEDEGKITTSSDDDVTKAALFKKLALTTNYFVDGRYIVTRMMRHNQAKLCQRLGCCCLRPWTWWYGMIYTLDVIHGNIILHIRVNILNILHVHPHSGKYPPSKPAESPPAPLQKCSPNYYEYDGVNKYTPAGTCVGLVCGFWLWFFICTWVKWSTNCCSWFVGLAVQQGADELYYLLTHRELVSKGFCFLLGCLVR